MKLGIFGGTFNPPHVGHLIVIECVRDQLAFDKVVLVPSCRPPNKIDTAIADGHHRLKMVSLAIEENAGLEVSDVELRRGGISYTVDTVRAIAAQFPRSSLSLIIGADNLMEFQTWKSPDEILTLTDLVVMTRPGFTLANDRFPKSVTRVNVPNIGISSSDIRRRIKTGRSIRYLVPHPVEKYIIHHALYRT
jgi:nicotinate-nucleotide adenylyltransferase